MNLLNLFWADLIGLAIIYVMARGAITGNFYSHGRSGPPKLIVSVKSRGLRLVFLLLATGLSLWVVIDLKSKLNLL